MTKQPTHLQIETVTRELRRAVLDAVTAWEENFPAPSWGEETEWERNNPSPRRTHAKEREEFKRSIEKEGDDLILKLKTGFLSVDELYPALKVELDRLHELRIVQLKINHN